MLLPGFGPCTKTDFHELALEQSILERRPLSRRRFEPALWPHPWCYLQPELRRPWPAVQSEKPRPAAPRSCALREQCHRQPSHGRIRSRFLCNRSSLPVTRATRCLVPATKEPTETMPGDWRRWCQTPSNRNRRCRLTKQRSHSLCNRQDVT